MLQTPQSPTWKTPIMYSFIYPFFIEKVLVTHNYFWQIVAQNPITELFFKPQDLFCKFYADFIYRVVINERHNVLHYCDPILSPGDFLSLLGSYQIWSI